MQKADSDVAYLYFLFDAQGDVFKIGKALNIWNRVNQLTDRIDTSRSRCLKFSGKPTFSAASQVLKVEGFIKAFCRDHNAPKMHGGDGHTEWYQVNAFKKVQEFVEKNRDFLGCGTIQSLPAVVATSAKPIVSADAIRSKREERFKHESEKFLIPNYETLNKTYTWLAATLVEGRIVGWVSGDLVTWKSKLVSPGLTSVIKRSGHSALIGSYQTFGDFQAHSFTDIKRWSQVFHDYGLDGLQAFTEVFEQIPLAPDLISAD
jgi:hypothetical protein